MSTVYIIENVNGKNFLPAKEFGDLRVVLTGKEDFDTARSKLRQAMDRIQEHDYLLLVGAPLHIAIAGHFAMKALGKVQFLIWDRDNYKYNVQTYHA